MENNVAVLIDFENIAAGTDKEGLGRFDVNALMGRIKDKGRILVARSYADWGRFSRFKQELLLANVGMYELTSHGMQDKNRADIALVVDAMDLAFTKPYVDTFIIVSGDSDFTPLVLKLRELNKRVIGCGTRSSTSRLLIQACDEFLFYDAVVKSRRARTTLPATSGGRPASKSARRQAAFDLLVDALDGLQRENPAATLAGVVKSAMLRKSPDFDETELGYPSFARFLDAAQEAGYVALDRDPKAGGYRVDSVEDTEDVDSHNTEEVAHPAGGEWNDTFLPRGAGRYLDILAEARLDLVSTPVRLEILEQIVDLTSDRRGKRRKTTVQTARDDLKKRMRNTHPNLPSRLLKCTFDALLQAGLLIHKDGTSIRSTTAPFHVEKNAAELNTALTNLYLATLREASCDLSDSATLAELFLGNRDRKRDIEEAVAWLAQGGVNADTSADLNEFNLDDLLEIQDGDTRTSLSTTGSSRPTPPARSEAKAQSEEAASTLDGASPSANSASPSAISASASSLADAATSAPAAKAAPPKKAAPAKATPAKAAATKAAPKATAKAATTADEPTDEGADDAPAKRKRTRRPKKADETASAADDNGATTSGSLDLDDLLSID